MTADKWKKIIIAFCQQAGTYKPFFDSAINALSEILERKDTATDQFKRSGGSMLIPYTNKAGKTNLVQNPFLKIINDLDKQALNYEKELGLTPLRLKRINGSALAQGKNLSLSELLAEIANEQTAEHEE